MSGEKIAGDSRRRRLALVRWVWAAAAVGALVPLGCASTQLAPRQERDLSDSIRSRFPNFRVLRLPESTATFDAGRVYRNGRSTSFVWDYGCGRRRDCGRVKSRVSRGLQDFRESFEVVRTSTRGVVVPWLPSTGSRRGASALTRFDVRITDLEIKRLDEAQLQAFMRKEVAGDAFENNRATVITEVVTGNIEFSFETRDEAAAEVELSALAAQLGGKYKYKRVGKKSIRSSQPLVFLFSTRDFSRADNLHCFSYRSSGEGDGAPAYRMSCQDGRTQCETAMSISSPSGLFAQCTPLLDAFARARQACKDGSAESCKLADILRTKTLADRPPEITLFKAIDSPFADEPQRLVWRALDAQKVGLVVEDRPALDVTLQNQYRPSRRCRTRYSLYATGTSGDLATERTITAGERAYPWWARIVTGVAGGSLIGASIGIGTSAISDADEGVDRRGSARAADVMLWSGIGVLVAAAALAVSDELCAFPMWTEGEGR